MPPTQNAQYKKFTELRFEYYVSGRTLWFNDSMKTGAMMLGYAVELSLKQILIFNDQLTRRLRNSHKHLNLYRKCVEVGAIPNNNFPDDLLQYVSDMFNQRYPSQEAETNAEANNRGHAISSSLTLIPVYDDLIIQLDDILSLITQDNSGSIGHLATHFVNRKHGQIFFHCNVAALKNTEIYRNNLINDNKNAEEKMLCDGLTPETIKYNLQNQKDRLETWNNAPDSLWNNNGLLTAIGPNFESLKSIEYANEFTYPGRCVIYP